MAAGMAGLPPLLYSEPTEPSKVVSIMQLSGTKASTVTSAAVKAFFSLGAVSQSRTDSSTIAGAGSSAGVLSVTLASKASS